MNSYVVRIEVPEGEVRTILEELEKSQRVILDCYGRHAELGAYLAQQYLQTAAPVTREEAEPKTPVPAGEGQELGGRWATIRLAWPGGQIIKVLGVDKTDEEMMEIDKKITDLLEDHFRGTD